MNDSTKIYVAFLIAVVTIVVFGMAAEVGVQREKTRQLMIEKGMSLEPAK